MHAAVQIVHRFILDFRGDPEDPRTIVMTETMRQPMLVLLRGKKEEDYVFTREDGEDGSRVVAPRKEWYSLCVSSGLGKYELVKRKNGESYKKYVGLNPHDFRRSALRNMTRRRVTEKVAMTISGAIHTVSFRPLQHRGRDGPGGSKHED
jgi:hypothetical protein